MSISSPSPLSLAAPPRKQSFHSIQAGRGVAALLVVLYHGNKLVASPAYWHTRVFGDYFRSGHSGVEFFFVLSGFIIAHVHWRDIGRPKRLSHYAGKRFRRIFPLYWLVLTVLVALALLPVGIASLHDVTPAAIVASYLLVGPDSHGGVLTVAWTLFHEIFFYLGFGLLIYGHRVGIAFFAAWLGLIGVGTVIPVPGVPLYLMSTLNVLFLVGALVELAVRRRWVAHPLAFAALGVTGFVLLGVEEVFVAFFTSQVRDLLYGIASAAGLAGVVTVERDHRLAAGRVLLTLGAASYSIYLTHYPLLSVVAKGMKRLGLVSGLPVGVGYIGMVAVTVGLGVVAHVTIERPLLDRLARPRQAVTPRARPSSS